LSFGIQLYTSIWIQEIERLGSKHKK